MSSLGAARAMGGAGRHVETGCPWPNMLSYLGLSSIFEHVLSISCLVGGHLASSPALGSSRGLSGVRIQAESNFSAT